MLTDNTSDMDSTISLFLDTAVQYRCTTCRPIKSSSSFLRQTIRNEAYKGGFGEEIRMLTGSHFEALPYEACGDRDYMVLRRDFPGIGDTPGLALMKHTVNPCYMQITVGPEGRQNVKPTYASCLVDLDGVLFFSSLEFSNVCRLVYCDPAGVPHGPATVGLAVPGHPWFGYQDTVFCLKLASWPQEAAGFFTRTRHHGWPSASVLAKVGKSDCFVVPIGHKDDSRPDLGWRLSFSHAERDIIYSMNDIMVGCVLLTKCLKKAMYKDESTSPCSYFFKTACMWVFEETDVNGRDIPSLFTSVLEYLIAAYKDRRLHHYFIPEQNLLAGIDVEVADVMITKLKSFQERLYPLLMFALASVINEARDMISSVRKLAKASHKDKYTLSDCEELFSNPANATHFQKVIDLQATTGDLYTRKCRVEYMFWTSNNALLYLIYEGKLQNLHSDFIYTLLCEQFDGVMEKLANLPYPSHQQAFRIMLNRDFGEFFQAIAVYLKERANINGSQGAIEAAQKCSEKAEELILQGIDLRLPDGWTDHGLSGLVSLATFYHLSEKQEKLQNKLIRLQQLLLNIDMQEIKYLGHETVISDQSLSVDVWKTDRNLYEQLILGNPDHYINIHCASLGWYLVGLMKKRDGEDISHIIEAMKKFDTYFHRECFKTPNNVMQAILSE